MSAGRSLRHLGDKSIQGARVVLVQGFLPSLSIRFVPRCVPGAGDPAVKVLWPRGSTPSWEEAARAHRRCCTKTGRKCYGENPSGVRGTGDKC